MSEQSFRAWVVDEVEGQHTFSLKSIDRNQLSEGEVLIKVHYSSLNYKDMLASSPKGGVIRNYPMIPGIDLSGEVVEDSTGTYQVGQLVAVIGYGAGVSHTGGLSEFARVPKDWVMPLPEGLTSKEVMMMGTAGLTAALAVQALLRHGMRVEEQPAILVTGASGGVGSVAVRLLRALGFSNVTALIRKPYQEAVVRTAGANNVMDATEVFIKENPLLLKEKFDFIIDNVGGEVATHLIPQVSYGGSMALCGNAGGIQLNTTVLPFILRGVNLLGIDSVNIPLADRRAVLDRFANEWHVFDELTVDEVGFSDVADALNQLKQGTHVGRTVVKVIE
ncbi:YhdH/YhfP family quinone oxidoreductase [Tuanshanicoccus lijuaniae]|uniref:YhdH/YhfP family quinone oxidoreductase n=1 Tax=Aerococcaceae bacterium zg-1292 TaxID=2774330 RepID=UPI001BD8AF75|nr:YhdH/YhfP family quinone oxidoreductase [Aerococcaceae bacterium zg-A91]MBS4458478.1 YhdH/YhfP family quinone oxidoreductase [Aerococcaceae bacterium zg-BR33]